MRTAVIGGSGYAGGELLRLLAVHPHFNVVYVSAHTNAGELITSVHPQLHSYAGISFVAVETVIQMGYLIIKTIESQKTFCIRDWNHAKSFE